MMPTTHQLVFDPIDDAVWDRALTAFPDASVYQMSAYGLARWGRDALLRIRWMRGDHVEAMAQAVVRRMPWLGGGLAYVPWGPVWRYPLHEPGHFRALVRAMRDELVVKQGLLLRLAPREYDEPGNPVAAILREEGYAFRMAGYRTCLVDLSGGVEAITHQLNRSWRRALKRASELLLHIEEGEGEDLYRTFAVLYREMVRRKGFQPGVNIDEFAHMQQMLPSTLKMHIMIARQGSQPLAALMASFTGDTGVGLLGATATDGLSTGAFHALNIAMMRWLHERGARYYDFGGYEPEQNRGTAGFKDGLPGRDVSFIGQFEASRHPATKFLIHTVEEGRRLARAARAITHHRARAPVHVQLEKAQP